MQRAGRVPLTIDDRFDKLPRECDSRDVQGHDNDDTVRAVVAEFGNTLFTLPFDWNGDPRDIGVALPDFAPNPSPSTVRVTTLIDPTGDSSIEPGPKDITGTVGTDDDSPTATGGFIWDTVLRAGKTVRHYGIYADQDYYAGLGVLNPPFFFPIDRNAFQDNVL
jgi:hypothetical protein